MSLDILMKEAFGWAIMIKLHLWRITIKDGSVFVHYKNIQTLVTEMYKVQNYLTPAVDKISALIFSEKAIRNWIQENRPCRLCKVYLNGVGFLNLNFDL